MRLHRNLALGRGTRRGGGGGIAPFSDYGWEYFDNFETAGAVNGRNGFIAPTGFETKWIAQSGYLRLADFAQADSTLLMGPVGGLQENVRFRLTYNKSDNTPEGAQAYREAFGFWYLWYQDANNFLLLDIDGQSGRVGLRPRIGGVNGTMKYWQPLTLGASGVLEVHIVNGRARLKLNGRWTTMSMELAYPWDDRDLTNVPSANRIGRAGISANFYRWPLAYDMGVTPLYVSVNDHSHFFARDNSAASGVSARPMSGTYNTRTPTDLVYRIVNYGTETVVQDWRRMGSPVWGSGNWSGTIAAPTGGPYIAQCGFVDNTGKYHYTDSRPFSVGALYVYDGQSNSAGRATDFVTPKTDTTATSKAAGNRAGSPLFEVVSNFNPITTQSALMAAKAASAAMGIPVLIVVTGVASEVVENLGPSNAGNWTRVTNVINTHGAPEGILWDQGEGNADNTGFTVTGYASLFFSNIVTGWRNATGNPNLPFLITHPGRFASATAPNGLNAALADDRRETIRQQFLTIAASDTRIKMGAYHLGQERSDNYHYTGQGHARLCERDGYSIAQFFGNWSVADGRGPIATSAALGGGRTTITLSFNLNGAASLTDLVNFPTGIAVPTPTLSGGLYGYQVSIDGFVSLLPISTMVRSGNTLVITLSSAAPAGTVQVRSMYGWSYDDSNLFYGTGYADGRADIPVAPIVTPLTAV